MKQWLILGLGLATLGASSAAATVQPVRTSSSPPRRRRANSSHPREAFDARARLERDADDLARSELSKKASAAGNHNRRRLVTASDRSVAQ